ISIGKNLSSFFCTTVNCSSCFMDGGVGSMACGCNSMDRFGILLLGDGPGSGTRSIIDPAVRSTDNLVICQGHYLGLILVQGDGYLAIRISLEGQWIGAVVDQHIR